MHIVHTENSCGWGGQEIRILTEMSGMAQRGYRLTLVCPPEAQIYQAALKRGLTVVPANVSRKNLKGVLAMRRVLQDLAPNIVNSHSSTDSWLVALANLTLAKPIPVLRTRHVSSPIKTNKASFWLYQRAAAHIAVTGEALKQQLHRDNAFALDSMTSVPTGINLAYFSPAERLAVRDKLGLAQDKLIIGILATLRNWKGHAYLLEAFKSLVQQQAHLTLLVVGDGPQRQNLELQAQNLGISDSVVFVGNQDNVPDWLNAMDIFTLPSYGDEGVPQGIMQAMACALPVVSTSVGAIQEAVCADQTGFIIKPKNVAELTSALAQLVHSSELRLQMGQAGLQRAQAYFGLEPMLDKMERLFLTYATKDVD